MKKILVCIVAIVFVFITIQTIRYNYEGRCVEDFEFATLENKEIKLRDIFDKNQSKTILYILPECESCIEKIDEILKANKFSATQLIVVSVSLKNFDYKKYFSQQFKNKEISFLIDKNHTFYRDFGLGFTEEFPTVLSYDFKSKKFTKKEL